MIIRKERPTDFQIVFSLIKEAFEHEPFSDGKEHFLVERLRQSDSFIPELSLIAEINEEIVGHILLSRLSIKNETDRFESLALAPVSVLPSHQRKGIGSLLIQEAHKRAKALGFRSIVLLGHEDYYPKFGYKVAETFGIDFPFDAPARNCMVLELVPDGLLHVKGTVEYPKAFFE